MCTVVTTKVLDFPEPTGQQSISFGLLPHSLDISTACKLTAGTSSTGPVTVEVNILVGFRRHVVLPDYINVNKCL